MKTNIGSSTNATQTLNSDSYFKYHIDLPSLFFNTPENYTEFVSEPDKGSGRPGPDKIFTEGTVRKMETGQLPDLWRTCHQLVNTVSAAEENDLAMQLIPVMQRIEKLEKEQVTSLLKNPVNRHVLVSNSMVEIVLIHWNPGKASDIHGHPGTGCVFKLLKGKLEELRYSPEPSPNLMGFHSYRSGDTAYIDDRIAYHQIGNPYGTSAISLHVYFKK